MFWSILRRTTFALGTCYCGTSLLAVEETGQRDFNYFTCASDKFKVIYAAPPASPAPSLSMTAKGKEWDLTNAIILTPSPLGLLATASDKGAPVAVSYTLIIPRFPTERENETQAKFKTYLFTSLNDGNGAGPQNEAKLVDCNAGIVLPRP